MSENSKVVVTLKADGGYDAPWIVLHAESVAEAQQLVAQAQQGLVVEVTNAAKAVQAQYKVAGDLGGQVVPQPAQQAPVQQPQYQQPQAAAPAAPAAAPSGPSGPSCAHGAYVWKEGVSKVGNAYKGWFCPSPSRTDCKAQFVR